MTTRTILAVLVAALMITAGCTSGGDDAGDGATTTNAGATTNGGTGTSTGDGATTNGGDGTTAGGGAPVVDDPEATLTAAGSFTSSWRTTFSDGETGETSDIGYTYAVDLEQDRYLVTFEMGGEDAGTVEYYFADGLTYMRITDTDEPAFYSVSEGQSFDLSAAFVTDVYYYSHYDAEWMQNRGTEQFDGVTVTRYEATDEWVTRVDDPGDGREGYTVTGSDYVTLVDGDGLVRQDAWSMEMTADDGTVSTWSWAATVTKVGSTTVEEPDWVDEARESGGY